MKPKNLPEKPKPKTAPLELSCPNCKADQDHIELIDNKDAFYCHNCQSTIYDPVGTQPIEHDDQHTKQMISSDMLKGDS